MKRPTAVSRARSRRSLLRLSALAGGSVLAGRLLPRSAAVARRSGIDGVPRTPLPAAITAVMQKPRYTNAGSIWNLLVTDLASGGVVYELQPDQLVLTGSVRKLFSVGLALRQLGADHRFTTPVYRTGSIDAQGVLHGDLILVAGGDLTFGGRLKADGSIEYTDFDHNDANNLGTAILTPQNPLFGLDSLAQQAAAAGIRSVTGEVIVDDRLFESFRVPNQQLLITPIMVNENMVDVAVSPTVPGRAAPIDWRPQTGAFTVTGAVNTVPAGTDDTITLSGDGHATCIGTAGCGGSVEGDIPVGYEAPLSGSPIFVQTFRIEDPAPFARTAFIEALQRAGVAVAVAAVASNPSALLPARDSYSAGSQVARFVSPPFAQYARLILKVSLNMGANLSLMHFGLANGARTIAGALAAERRALVEQIGIDGGAFNFPTNGSGSPDSQATARATVRMLTAMSRTADAQIYHTALPELGVNGSLAHSGVDLPGRGHVFAKPGTTVENGTLIAQNIAGYIEARSGRQLAFALFLNDGGPLENISDVSDVFEDEAVIANAIYESA